MNALNNDTIRKIALLARLKVEDNEVARYQQELTAILHMVEQIQNVDTSNIAADAISSANQELTQRTRHDVVTAIVDAIQQKELQNIAPHTEQGLYLVPQVINDEL